MSLLVLTIFMCFVVDSLMSPVVGDFLKMPPDDEELEAADEDAVEAEDGDEFLARLVLGLCCATTPSAGPTRLPSRYVWREKNLRADEGELRLLCTAPPVRSAEAPVACPHAPAVWPLPLPVLCPLPALPWLRALPFPLFWPLAAWYCGSTSFSPERKNFLKAAAILLDCALSC